MPPAAPSATETRRLGRGSLAWRLGGLALALVVLTSAQFVDTDDFWPLGSLSQYGAPKSLDGVVRSVYLEASFPGEPSPRPFALTQRSTGVERGEVEGQLERFVRDPALLQAFANAYAAQQPHRPQPTVLYLRRSVQQLQAGRAVGTPQILTLAQWQVRR